MHLIHAIIQSVSAHACIFSLKANTRYARLLKLNILALKKAWFQASHQKSRVKVLRKEVAPMPFSTRLCAFKIIAELKVIFSLFAEYLPAFFRCAESPRKRTPRGSIQQGSAGNR
mmetsp:Transcript_72/g.157  ORF Transcript_72/g.157 Transcript_72/m.157 type:complete len:115 (+) Transcript_72:34-378(+)